MARKRPKKIPQELITLTIEGLSHDGRGIARQEGKTVFVDGALTGETVSCQYTATHRNFDEVKTIEVIKAVAQRVQPQCEFFGLCGGCSLQHMNVSAQMDLKQSTLMEQFAHFGGIENVKIEPPLLADAWHYRRKARLAVRYVHKKGKVLVGFREKRNHFVANINDCAILDKRIACLIAPLSEMIGELEAKDQIPQIEVAVGDDAAALVFRHLVPLADGDRNKLLSFCKNNKVHCYLQSGGPDTVFKAWPEAGEERLKYSLPEQQLSFGFHPMDFTQVNAGINEAMIAKALSWLDLKASDRVLDLFCGLGNFTLPIARHCRQVIGIEGSEEMVLRGKENARLNGLENAQFYAADLYQSFDSAAAFKTWAEPGFDKILLDPPRSGAMELVENIRQFSAQRIVYVSCNPATLARDAGILQQQGYRLLKTGVMDMFPHTTHVESIALFECIDRKPFKQAV